MSELVYVSDNKEFSVEIHSNSLEYIYLECNKSSNYETGGILIGKYSDDMRTAIIKSESNAPIDSKSGKASFRRGINGLFELLNKKWDKTGEYYLGEWHFHPNSTSQPSLTDIRQMKDLSRNKKLKCPEPILLIIGGNAKIGWSISLHVFKDDKVIELQHTK